MKLHISDDLERVAEVFGSITEFTCTIDHRTVNRAFEIRKDKLCSQKKETNDGEWFMTRDYEHSVYLMRTGYKEGYRQIMAKPLKLARLTNQSQRRYDIVGHAPVVPNYIIGHPLCMVRTIRPLVPARVVKIFYDRGVHCGISAEKIAEYARLIYDAIRKIEADGVNVELYVGNSSQSTRQTISCFICVKKSSTQINPMKMAYLLVHPSFFRRQLFHWQETCPSITDVTFSDGYGYPLSNQISFYEYRRMMLDLNVMDEDDVLITTNFLRRNAHDASDVIREIERQAKLDTAPQSSHRPR